MFQYLTIALPLLVLYGCSSPAPPTPSVSIDYEQLTHDQMTQLVSKPGWTAWIDAAAATQKAYHLIVDTPIQQLDASETGIVVTMARDQFRHASSFALENGACVYGGQFPVRDGMSIRYTCSEYGGGYIDEFHIVSSRNKQIMSFFLS